MRGPDHTLVAEAIGGNNAAREKLLGLLQPVLRAFFINRIGKRPEVDDLIQNTLLRVHRGLSDLRDHRRLKAFAMKAALFELQDYYRGRYSAKELLYDSDLPSLTLSAIPPDALHLDLEKALSSLTPRAREIIELREYGYRYEEIAGLLETTEAAVKMQVKRAFSKLREKLATVAILFWFVNQGSSFLIFFISMGVALLSINLWRL